jgi:LPS export ABC transporter protein LptC
MNFYYYFCISSLILWLSVSCSNRIEDIEVIKQRTEGNVESAKDVSILYSDSAIVRMRIRAPLMLNSQSAAAPKRTFPDGVWVDFFDSRQEPSSHLTAKYAEYAENEKIIVLRDSVVIRNYKNEQLETEELFWNERDSRIYSKKFVKVTTPQEIIHGYGFSSNMEFTEWEIDSVSGIFQSGTLMGTEKR